MESILTPTSYNRKHKFSNQNLNAKRNIANILKGNTRSLCLCQAKTGMMPQETVPVRGMLPKLYQK